MAIWNAQSVQLVWFITSAEGLKADLFFEAFVAEEPTDVQRNKIPGPTNPFFSVATGSVTELGSQVQVQVQPGRLDVIVTPGAQDPNVEPGLPMLDTDTVIQWLRTRLGAGQVYPAVYRLAFVVNLLETAPDIAAASKTVVEKTGFDPGFSDFSDFSVQVNLRKPLLASNGQMNRLLRYNVAAFQNLVFSLQALPGNPQPLVVPITQEQFASLLMVDVNSVPDGRIIASETQIPMFAEMIDEMLRIGQNGKISALKE